MHSRDFWPKLAAACTLALSHGHPHATMILPSAVHVNLCSVDMMPACCSCHSADILWCFKLDAMHSHVNSLLGTDLSSKHRSRVCQQQGHASGFQIVPFTMIRPPSDRQTIIRPSADHHQTTIRLHCKEQSPLQCQAISFTMHPCLHR